MECKSSHNVFMFGGGGGNKFLNEGVVVES